MLAHMGQQAPAERSEVKPEWDQLTGHLRRPPALTWGSNSPAARRRQQTGDNTACRVWGPISQGPHGMTGALVIHGDTVGEGITDGVVGLPIVATDLPRLPADLLGTVESTKALVLAC